jgi:hypothetical protein
VKPFEYRKHIFFIGYIHFSSLLTLLLLGTSAPLSPSSCPFHFSDYTDYAMPVLTGKRIIMEIVESIISVVSQPVGLKGRSCGLHIYQQQLTAVRSTSVVEGLVPSFGY